LIGSGSLVSDSRSVGKTRRKIWRLQAMVHRESKIPDFIDPFATYL
jgi:hypothetical protein